MQANLSTEERKSFKQFCKKHKLTVAVGMELFKLGVHFGVFRQLPSTSKENKIRLFQQL